jgi:twitching motility two-component system response regulator PilH
MAGKKILVVDDSPTDRHHLSEMLAKKGYQVITAENAEDAISKAKSGRPDLILMDVVMPGRGHAGSERFSGHARADHR